MSYEQAEKQAKLLADGLDEMSHVVGVQLGLATEGQKLASRAQQVREDRFRVLVVGEFKRGKSTLLNSLLGDDILPRKVAECTAVVTVIQYGDVPQVQVISTDGIRGPVLTVADFKKNYELTLEDSEDRSAAMDRFSRVDHAVLSYPVELCRHRIELVDSPGLGAHTTRTQRTQKFLPQADAIVFVLYAPQFLKEDESHFLETVLLPMGLRNVFFVINGWNLIDESVVRPEDADRERAELEGHIKQRLSSFCLINGKDRSAERIFRINALGALKARMRKPVGAAMLEESNVPAFEASLQKFLVEDRGKARTDIILGAIKTTTDEVNRFIATQLSLAGKSIAEVEGEIRALKPKLERLRSIRQHIVGFLQSQGAILQDRLVISFHNHIKKLEAALPAEVAKFDLKPITGRWMVWAAITDWARAEENKFTKQAEACLKPQMQRLLERQFAAWQHSVIKNEMAAVMIDVEKHLLEEAAEYQRVMGEIEARIGIQGSPMQIKELVERWLGAGTGGFTGHVDLQGVGAMGEFFGWMIGGILIEVAAHTVMHIATGGLTLIITGVLSIFRLGWREYNLQSQIQEKIVAGIKTGLNDMSLTQAAEIRGQIRGGFGGLEKKIAGNIDEEIAIIDASLQSILDRKKEKEYSADNEKTRLESARKAIAGIVSKIHAALLTV